VASGEARSAGAAAGDTPPLRMAHAGARSGVARNAARRRRSGLNPPVIDPGCLIEPPVEQLPVEFRQRRRMFSIDFEMRDGAGQYSHSLCCIIFGHQRTPFIASSPNTYSQFAQTQSRRLSAKRAGPAVDDGMRTRAA